MVGVCTIQHVVPAVQQVRYGTNVLVALHHCVAKASEGLLTLLYMLQLQQGLIEYVARQSGALQAGTGIQCVGGDPVDGALLRRMELHSSSV
jgi:hypothetical protein